MSIAATIGAVGAIAGGTIGAVGASSAAGAQASASENAAQLQYQLGEQSLNFQEQEYNQQQANSQPWLQAGSNAVNQLSKMVGNSAGTSNSTGVFDPSNPFAAFTQQFQAPQLNNTTDPGYLARLNLGQTAFENSAAARGGVLSSGTAANENQLAQDYASNEYSNVYSRALNQYQNAFNVYNTNQTNTFNRLATLSGIGQQTNTALGQTGAQAANNVGYINSVIGGQVGQSMQNAGTATASGYAGIANALGSTTSGLSSVALMNQIYQSLYGGAGGGAYGPGNPLYGNLPLDANPGAPLSQ